MVEPSRCGGLAVPSMEVRRLRYDRGPGAFGRVHGPPGGPFRRMPLGRMRLVEGTGSGIPLTATAARIDCARRPPNGAAGRGRNRLRSRAGRGPGRPKPLGSRLDRTAGANRRRPSRSRIRWLWPDPPSGEDVGCLVVDEPVVGLRQQPEPRLVVEAAVAGAGGV